MDFKITNDATNNLQWLLLLEQKEITRLLTKITRHQEDIKRIIDSLPTQKLNGDLP